MADCATAAFMKRKSRIADVSAPVPSAAQAAWRMKRRRVMTETDLSFMGLPLDGEVGGTDNLMHHRTDTIPHLRKRRRVVVGEPRIGDVIGDEPSRRWRQLAGAEQ